MNKTPYYGLNIPSDEFYYHVEDFNENMQIIDAELHRLNTIGGDNFAVYNLGEETGTTIILEDLPYNTKGLLTIYGKTVETGTGDKSPDNPYILTGVGESGMIPVKVNDTTINVPVSAPLYSLPNSIKDEIDLANGKVVRRTWKVALDGSEDEGWYLWRSDAETTQVFRTTMVLPNCFDMPLDTGVVPDGQKYFSRFVMEMFHNNFSQPNYSLVDENNLWQVTGAWSERENAAIMSNESVGIRILKTRLSGWNDSWTTEQKVAAFKTWLASHPITVIYELTEPIIESITPITIPITAPLTTVTTEDSAQPEIMVEILNTKHVSDSVQLGGKMWWEYISVDDVDTFKEDVVLLSDYNTRTSFYQTGNGLDDTKGALEIRETDLSGDAFTTLDYAPKILFNWLDVAARYLALSNNGAICVVDTNGNLGRFDASQVYGAVWNDYAEFRKSKTPIDYGRVVVEDVENDDYVTLSHSRLNSTASIVSDTFGFVIGENPQECEYSLPVAVSGRVLAYTDEDRNTFKVGDPVCSGVNGTVSKMTREEVREYPECIIGVVSSIPQYETWGTGNVKVDGRIWIRVK